MIQLFPADTAKMKATTPDIELSTLPLEEDSQSTTEAKQTPLRRRHPLYLALLSPCFYTTPASRFWRRCPPLLIQTLRSVSFVIMSTVTIFLLFQLIIETGKTSEFYSVKAARALAVIIVLHIIFHVLLVLYFRAYCYHGRAHPEGGLFGLEEQNSPETAARYIRENISRDFISATCTEVLPQRSRSMNGSISNMTIWTRQDDAERHFTSHRVFFATVESGI